MRLRELRERLQNADAVPLEVRRSRTRGEGGGRGEGEEEEEGWSRVERVDQENRGTPERYWKERSFTQG